MTYSHDGERVHCRFKGGCPEEGIREVEVPGNGTIYLCPYHVPDPGSRAHLARLWQLSRLRGVRLTAEVTERIGREFGPIAIRARRARNKQHSSKRAIRSSIRA